MEWFIRKVQKGAQVGRKIGYPTLNFRVGDFGRFYRDGVYACDIRIAGKLHKGALYFGPHLSKSTKVLEVHVPELNKKIYGQFIQFRLLKKIRNAKILSNLDDLKRQIRKDLLKI